jgi:hypothetical protein
MSNVARGLPLRPHDDSHLGGDFSSVSEPVGHANGFIMLQSISLTFCSWGTNITNMCKALMDAALAFPGYGTWLLAFQYQPAIHIIVEICCENPALAARLEGRNTLASRLAFRDEA